MIHLGGAQVSNPTRLCIHLLRAQGMLYNEPVFSCSSQAMQEHVLALSFGHVLALFRYLKNFA